MFVFVENLQIMYGECSRSLVDLFDHECLVTDRTNGSVGGFVQLIVLTGPATDGTLDWLQVGHSLHNPGRDQKAWGN